MLDAYIRDLFADPEMLRMGHAQRLADHNLGLGWIYYALGRLIRPARAVVVGSHRGFVPTVIARSLQDNTESGEVWFIDPSLADDFWKVPERVAETFRRLGTPNVRHFPYTTQEFVTTADYAGLSGVGLVMIDGYHTAEQARFDYLAFVDKLGADAVVMFHDSTRQRTSSFYGEDRKYEHTVCRLMERLKQTPGLEVFTLPFASGLTLVRGRPGSLNCVNEPFDDA
jgi:hypothetical protein